MSVALPLLLSSALQSKQSSSQAVLNRTPMFAAHESARRVLVEHAAEFARCCSKPRAAGEPVAPLKAGVFEELVPGVTSLLHDQSWRVRYCGANHISELAEAFGQEVTR
jgi:hypothetical protein